LSLEQKYQVQGEWKDIRRCGQMLARCPSQRSSFAIEDAIQCCSLLWVDHTRGNSKYMYLELCHGASHPHTKVLSEIDIYPSSPSSAPSPAVQSTTAVPYLRTPPRPLNDTQTTTRILLIRPRLLLTHPELLSSHPFSPPGPSPPRHFFLPTSLSQFLFFSPALIKPLLPAPRHSSPSACVPLAANSPYPPTLQSSPTFFNRCSNTSTSTDTATELLLPPPPRDPPKLRCLVLRRFQYQSTVGNNHGCVQFSWF
jgi:hypothetical protein